MAEIGSVLDGKYEILTEIGRGGMSVVYLAMDTHLNKQWAVKEIRKKGSGKNDEVVVNSLLAEANMMKKLDHPALPRIVDIIDNGRTIYVVMDYIEGESLDKILAENGTQAEDLVIGWAKQLCDALSYLHSQKPPIIYRDMKPANVMLMPEGTIKIIDF
ncbi:MAG: serine/threonine protein kinase, partial [Blautia sp.]|nr:serine/threonine protein kinase [Blautia sp.]